MEPTIRRDERRWSLTGIRFLCLGAFASVPLLEVYGFCNHLPDRDFRGLNIIQWIFYIAAETIYIRHRVVNEERSYLVEIAGYVILPPLLLLTALTWGESPGPS